MAKIGRERERESSVAGSGEVIAADRQQVARQVKEDSHQQRDDLRVVLVEQ